MKSFDIIKKSHQLNGDPKALRDYYREWAETYDRDVSNERYVGPSIITGITVLVADLYSLGRDAAGANFIPGQTHRWRTFL